LAFVELTAADAFRDSRALRMTFRTTGLFSHPIRPEDDPAPEACGAVPAGFHMASLWEIFEPSHLRYDTALGVTDGGLGLRCSDRDSRMVRTGAGPSGFQPAPRANCHAWASSEAADFGTLVALSAAWAFDGLGASPWAAVDDTCSSARPVWCVED
jgi:hypothetical protein